MDDCKEVACSDKITLLKKGLKAMKKGVNGKSVNPEVSEFDQCPLDRNQVGVATWGLLHTIAANYPDNPTEKQRKAVQDIIMGLSVVYPCSYCAKDFRNEIARDPPKVGSRCALAMWMCMQHNHVNRKLGKSEFNCDMTELDKRWRHGDEKCNI